MSSSMRVDDVELFKNALGNLKAKTHGDTLAVFLALKYNQGRLPMAGDSREGVRSKVLESLLDEFYTKRHPALGSDSGRVCRIFHAGFTPPSSHGQNNWRDFFRYGLGVGCLAQESRLLTEFVAEHRSDCEHLIQNDEGKHACALHPIHTKYIRGLDKPKLFHWHLEGKTGAYKVVNLNDPRLLDVILPLSSRVPLDSLIVALYFGASWSSFPSVTIEQFATDFKFESEEQVTRIFGSEVENPELAALIEEEARKIESWASGPFILKDKKKRVLSIREQSIRTHSFRQAVLKAYDYACGVCGLKLDTPEGKWAVQAAHIYPHQMGGSDDVRNGIALCHSHHWAFDNHVYTIDPSYSLLWYPPAVKTNIYIGGQLKLPGNAELWPDQPQALEWHRKEMSKKLKSARTPMPSHEVMFVAEQEAKYRLPAK